MLTAETVRRVTWGRVGIGVIHAGDLDDQSRGRAAAAEALRRIGSTAPEIPTGADRGPVWPEGIVGSVAHTADVAIAIVASSAGFRSLGIDLESSERAIDARTARRICTASERDSFSDRTALLSLFCAKEATYKALAPLGATKLGFQDVAYAPLPDGMLLGRIVRDSVDSKVPRTFAARVVQADGFVVAAVLIDR